MEKLLHYLRRNNLLLCLLLALLIIIIVITVLINIYTIDVNWEYLKDNRYKLISNIVIFINFSREDLVEIITGLAAFINLIYLTLVISTENSESDNKKNTFNDITLFCESNNDDNNKEDNGDKNSDYNIEDSSKRDKGKGKAKESYNDSIENEEDYILDSKNSNEELELLMKHQEDIDLAIAMSLSGDDILFQQRLIENYKIKSELTEDQLKDYDSDAFLDDYSNASSNNEDDIKETKNKQLSEQERKQLREDNLRLEKIKRDEILKECLTGNPSSTSAEFSAKRKLDNIDQASSSNLHDNSDKPDSKEDYLSQDDKGKKRVKKEDK